ncbi:TPA: hypothetical protein N0F65_001125 [Lagenidium giganteum]|uniref:Uncharacterized protein n=1 Tax=Lagenidium giganteum TaxID=4803 RepID=A0AAV2YGP7_9STRA|nr:TPA: hypothetical protein N0F65_001125 [Lagenidium giganteum]
MKAAQLNHPTQQQQIVHSLSTFRSFGLDKPPTV